MLVATDTCSEVLIKGKKWKDNLQHFERKRDQGGGGDSIKDHTVGGQK